MDNPTNTNVLERMGIPPLWQKGHRGEGVTIAILDTGMIHDPDFSERIVYDQDFTDENSARHRNHWHGTRVANAALAIAPEARIANLKVIPRGKELRRATVIRALRHCVEQYPRYRIVNLSLSFLPDGCPEHCELCTAVDEAFRAGMMVVVAAGNEGPGPDTLTCPARAKWALSSVATWTAEEDAWWENTRWYKKWWYKASGTFGKTYGTSYSAPYAAGGAAILFSAFKKVDADTVRFVMLDIDRAAEEEKGHQTTLRYDHVYEKLKSLQQWAPISILTKPGALYPIIRPF